MILNTRCLLFCAVFAVALRLSFAPVSAQQPDDTTEAIVRLAITQLKSKQVSERVSGAEALGKLGQRAKALATKPLCDAMLDSSAKVHLAASEALERVHPELYAHVKPILVDRESASRTHHARQIQKMGKAAVGCVKILVFNIDRVEKGRISAAIASTRSPKSRSEQIETILANPSDETLACLEAMVEIARDDKDLAALMLSWLASSPNQSMRMIATVNLIRMEYPGTQEKAVKALATALRRDKSTIVRTECARSLEKLGANAKEALAALREAKAFDPDAPVRAAADAAMRSIESSPSVAPAESIAADADAMYLSNMEAFDVKVSEGRFGKKGNLGFKAGNPPRGRILVDGKESPNGLSMCAISDSFAIAKYRLPNDPKFFVTRVALNDSAGAPGALPGQGKIPTPITFQVLGDDRILWSSKRVDMAKIVQECKIDLTGIEVLELRVDCPGQNTNAHAVWLEPRLVAK